MVMDDHRNVCWLPESRVYTELSLEDHARYRFPWQSRSRDPWFHVSKQWLNHVGDPAIDGERKRNVREAVLGFDKNPRFRMQTEYGCIAMVAFHVDFECFVSCCWTGS